MKKRFSTFKELWRLKVVIDILLFTGNRNPRTTIGSIRTINELEENVDILENAIEDALKYLYPTGSW